jgi:hypothetical protein
MKVAYTEEALSDLDAIADWLIAHYPDPRPFPNPARILYLGHDHRRRHRKSRRTACPARVARFRAWFEAFDAAQFDAAIERDERAGKLDTHAEEALAAHRAEL